MRLAIHHEQFDADVSSGTVHAAYQWHQLCRAFDVTDLAVINLTDDDWPVLGDGYAVTEYPTLGDFVDDAGAQIVVVHPAGEHYRWFNFPDGDFWLLIGGTEATGLDPDVGIPTYHNVELYPREAAAIIMEELSWQFSS